MRHPLKLLALAALVAACGSSPDVPHDGPPPDAPADAPPDVAIDAPPDGSPTIDDDHDGHPASADCDDHDPAVWQALAYSFRDADGDGHTAFQPGTICSGAALPAGYATVASDPDCDDADPARFTQVTGYLDLDGDGVGVGPAIAFCTGGAQQPGFAAEVGDCAPMDAARQHELPYSFRDADGDGAAVVEVGVLCSGPALPPGYLVTAPVNRPLDCDDADPAVFVAQTVFTDADHDGIGAGAGQLACTAGSAPPGFALTSTDCDDANPAVFVALVYTAFDGDGDGVTVPQLGTRCTAGSLAPPFFATAHGDDCDDGNPAIFTQQSYVAVDEDGDGASVPASGSLCTDGHLPLPFLPVATGRDCDDTDASLTHFAVLYPDADHDGVGAAPRTIACLGAALPSGLVAGGYDEDDNDPAVIETEELDDLLDVIL